MWSTADVQVSTLVYWWLNAFLFCWYRKLVNIVFFGRLRWFSLQRTIKLRVMSLNQWPMLGSRISRIRLLLLNSAELQWGIVCEPIDLELSIKEDVFIVLLQFYLKHVFVLVTLLLSLIVVVLNFVLLNSLNCIQRKRRYRSIQVANWLILVFIVAERSWR